MSDGEEEVADRALSWFGYAQAAVNGNGIGSSPSKSESSLSLDESFDEDRLPEHSKDIRLTAAEVS